jgi:hypothetical protein
MSPATLAALALGALALDHGVLTITKGGVPSQYHILAVDSPDMPTNITVAGTELTIVKGPNSAQGTRLWTHLDGSGAPDKYPTFSLLNTRVSFTADLSAAPCGFNAALFFVSMPGYAPNGSLAPGGYHNYYCDGNNVGGVWCWEMDTMEANQNALQVTAHKCNAPAGQYISHCDGAGAGVNAGRVDAKSLCPDSSCTIDTRKPFRVAQDFVAKSLQGATVVAIQNTLTQEGRTFSFGTSARDEAYLQDMSAALEKGMVMTFQLWGGPDLDGHMGWLDGFTGCTASCGPSSRFVLRDIDISPLSGALFA